MQKFSYKGWDSNKKIIKDVIEEDNIMAAREKIKSRGIVIIDIYPYKDMSSLIKSSGGSLKDEEIINYCGQMATMIESGINLIMAFEIIIEQAKLKVVKDIYRRVLVNIKKGNALSDAMNSTGKFPKLLNDMVRSGEISGNLDKILYNMEDYYQRESFIKNKIKSATTYPKILLAAGVGIIGFFNYFIMPIFKNMFNDNMELPLYTRLLLNTADFINNNIPFVILFTIISIMAIRYLLSTKKIGGIKDYILLKLPGFGTLNNYIIISRVTRTLGIFFKSGVPIFNALKNIQMIVGNEYISSKIAVVRDEIIAGMKIADSFEKEKLFEPLVIQMIRVGEETGRLDEMLGKLAAIYDRKIEITITSLMGMMEPIFTLVVGLIVGSIIIAMAVPVLTISQNIM